MDQQEQQAGLNFQSSTPVPAPHQLTLAEFVRRALSSDAVDRLEGQELDLLQAFWEAGGHRLPLSEVMRLGGASHTRRISGLREKGLVIEIVGNDGHSPIYELERLANENEWRVIQERKEAKKKARAEESAARAAASGWKMLGDGTPADGDLVATWATYGYAIYVYNSDFGFSSGTECYRVLEKPVIK